MRQALMAKISKHGNLMQPTIEHRKGIAKGTKRKRKIRNVINSTTNEKLQKQQQREKS